MRADGELRYEGPATIVVDGHDFGAEVVYWVDPAKDSRLGSWNGVFTILGGHYFEPDEAQLRLPDGRVGRIVVTHVSVRIVAGDSNGRFVGSGSPPS